ncbi:MAG: peptidoglycan-binding protein [Geminicoccaceae bacterium]
MHRFLIVISLALFFLSPNTLAASENGPTPDDVAFVQGLLQRLGYDPGPIDGICGDMTVAAVRAFHSARNLPLEDGDIEPQAATVASNLMTVITENVVSPKRVTLDVYKNALAGEGDAALAIGNMYDQGQAVTADSMLAYAWWTVAEANGNLDAGRLKAELVNTGGVSAHEMQFATSLAETINLGNEGRLPQTQQAPADDDEARQDRHVTM